MTNRKHILTSGALWFSAATLFSKLVSFGAQVILAWYLTPEDFGIFAIALSLAAWVTFLRNGGADQVLVQRGSEYDALAGKILTYSLMFNSIALVLLIILSQIAASYYNQEILVVIMLIIGLSYLVTSQSVVLKSKLAIDQRYRELSGVAAFSNFGRHFIAIVLVIITGSMLSLAFPMLVEPVLALIAAYWLLGSYQKPHRISFFFIHQMFLDTRWVMLSNLAMALTLFGVYFVASWYITTSEVGVFFFAFQLIMSVTVLVTNSINHVVFPHLSNAISTVDFERYVEKGISLCLLVGGLLTGMMLLILKPLITTLWQGKWDSAIPVSEMLVLVIPFVLSSTLVFSILGAKGLWVDRCISIATVAFLDLVAVGVGGYIGGLHSAITFFVCAKLLSNLVILFFASMRIFEAKSFDKNWMIDLGLVVSMMIAFLAYPSHAYPVVFVYLAVFIIRMTPLVKMRGI